MYTHSTYLLCIVCTSIYIYIYIRVHCVPFCGSPRTILIGRFPTHPFLRRSYTLEADEPGWQLEWGSASFIMGHVLKLCIASIYVVAIVGLPATTTENGQDNVKLEDFHYTTNGNTEYVSAVRESQEDFVQNVAISHDAREVQKSENNTSEEKSIPMEERSNSTMDISDEYASYYNESNNLTSLNVDEELNNGTHSSVDAESGPVNETNVDLNSEMVESTPSNLDLKEARKLAHIETIKHRILDKLRLDSVPPFKGERPVLPMKYLEHEYINDAAEPSNSRPMSVPPDFYAKKKQVFVMGTDGMLPKYQFLRKNRLL